MNNTEIKVPGSVLVTAAIAHLNGMAEDAKKGGLRGQAWQQSRCIFAKTALDIVLIFKAALDAAHEIQKSNPVPNEGASFDSDDFDALKRTIEFSVADLDIRRKTPAYTDISTALKRLEDVKRLCHVPVPLTQSAMPHAA